MQLTVQNKTFNGSEIMSKKGNVTGHAFQLGVGSISARRKELRASGMSANEASAEIARMLELVKGLTPSQIETLRASVK